MNNPLGFSLTGAASEILVCETEVLNMQNELCLYVVPTNTYMLHMMPSCSPKGFEFSIIYILWLVT